MDGLRTKILPLPLLLKGGWGDYGMGPGMMWGWWGMGWIFMLNARGEINKEEFEQKKKDLL